jgi:hypothetical protein
LPRLQKIYHQIKEMALGGKSSIRVSPVKMFLNLLPDAAADEDAVRHEVLSILSDLILVDRACLVQWWSVYEDHIVASGNLIRHLSERPKLVAKVMR